MTLPVLVPPGLRESLADAIHIAEYLLDFNRYELEADYLAHVEQGLSRLRAMAQEVGALGEEDERLRTEEQERIDRIEQEKGKDPWIRFR